MRGFGVLAAASNCKRRLQTSTSSFEMSSALVGACRFFRSARSEVGDDEDEEGAVRCLCATGAT